MINPFDNVLTGIGGPLERVSLDWRAHLAASMNSEPLELPDSIADRLANASTIDSVADDLAQLFNLMTRAIHTGGYKYVAHSAHLDFNGSTYSVDIFHRTNGYHAGDPFYTSDSFIVIDCHKVYAMEDNDNVGESGLFETTVGYWLSPLRESNDARLLDGLNDRLSVGYSSYPYGELEAHLIGEPVWAESRKCYVCRVDCAPYLCRVDPVAPCYGG